jgi:hypothetical protein
MSPKALVGLRAAFDQAGVKPGEVNFPRGPNEYLQEVVRSGIHAKSRQAARELLGRS